MAIYQPFYQSPNIFVFGFKPQGSGTSGTGPSPGTYVRSYPPLHQSVRVIRFGFTPRGSSTPSVAAVETNTHFVRRIARHGESYQRFRFNTQAADDSSAVAQPSTNVHFVRPITHRQPVFRSFHFNSLAADQSSTPPASVSVRYYPPLFQPAVMIRFGFIPRGSSGAPSVVIATNTHFVRPVIYRQTVYQRVRFNTLAADLSGPTPPAASAVPHNYIFALGFGFGGGFST